MKTIFLKGLAVETSETKETSEKEILSLFNAYGDVIAVRLVRHKQTGKSAGLCFVEMADDEDAVMAASSVNGTSLMGKTLVCNISTRPMPERTSENESRKTAQ